MPNFQCAPIAHAYRIAGHDIATKSEAEQAFILHRFAPMAIRYGIEWRKYAAEDLQAARTTFTAMNGST